MGSNFTQLQTDVLPRTICWGVPFKVNRYAENGKCLTSWLTYFVLLSAYLIKTSANVGGNGQRHHCDSGL